ncbi:MAG TPA: hypothetical protein VFR98_11335 [Agromyces sp.]|nr:hypothetical protein [Agromyces sp.]
MSTERGDGAEDGAHVGVVDDVLEDHDAARRGEQVARVGQRGSLERGERPAVHAVSGDRLEFGGIGEVHRDVERRECRLEAGQPLLLHEHRPRRAPGVDGAADDLGRFGDENATFRLGDAAQCDIRQPGVVGDGIGCRVADVFDSHGSSPPSLPACGNIPVKRGV